jgi:hypothetical protein
MKQFFKNYLAISFLVFFAAFVNPALAQDTTKVASADTTQVAEADSKKEKKKKDSWVVYLGGSLSQLDVSDQFKSDGQLGYQLGLNYRRGKFLYWGAGAKFTNAVYGLKEANSTSDSSSISVQSFDIPLTVGLDLLFFSSRIFTVRTFVGAIPSFVVGVTDDTGLGYEKEDLNSFVLYGQGGIGIDIAFLDIELGYNLGFQDLFKNDFQSKPGQAFLNLGFRF